jgi:hypothetical protein
MMTRSILLTQGKFTLIDDGDFEWLNQYRWHVVTSKRGDIYAARSAGPAKNIRMHRMIMNAPDGIEVDHINGDGLDNRRGNLRLCSKSQNQCNRGITSRNSSGYKGVRWNKKNQKYEAQITINRIQKSLGCFDDPQEAARAYDVKARELHGEFAQTNF